MTINVREFLNTADELHALVIGLAEIFPFWPPRHKYHEHEDCVNLNAEYHYYSLGRILGVLCWLVLAKLLEILFT